MSDKTAAYRERLVLLVEDRAASAAALEMAVGDMADVTLRTVSNGAAAWSFLESGAGEKVCAVITDLDMPLIDGIELIRRIRSSAAHAHTPVIVISGTTEVTAPQKALEAGANAFFPKPWSPGRVCATLERLLYERNAKRH
ncbi:MAG: response regulator [Bryobacteraceae bacterium]|jgi:CheY-like chemotaxis protein